MISYFAENNSILIEGDIEGDTDLLYIQDALSRSEKDKPLQVKINSFGGDLATGIAIFNLLRNNPLVETVNMGIAASAAALIFMSGTKRTMGFGSLVMNHRASVPADGNVEDLQEAITLLNKLDEQILSILIDVAGLTKEEAEELMLNETYLSGPEALEYGIATHTDETIKASAHGNIYKARNYAGLQIKLSENMNEENKPIEEVKPSNTEVLIPEAKVEEAIPENKVEEAPKEEPKPEAKVEVSPVNEAIASLTKLIGEMRAEFNELKSSLSRKEEVAAPTNKSTPPRRPLAAAPFQTISNCAPQGLQAKIDAESDPDKKLQIIYANWKNPKGK